MKKSFLFLLPFLLFLIYSCEKEATDDSALTGNISSSKTPALPAKFMDTTGTKYAWLKNYHLVHTLYNRIPPPAGFKRTEAGSGSYTEWLRMIPLKPGKPDVLLYNGSKKGNQQAHHAVIDIDVGDKDLQQCADAAMRLRAEFLFTAGEEEKIHFNFTSGHEAAWKKYKAGERPTIKGNSVSWSKKANADGSHKSFRRYMNLVFNYAGTASLEKEMKSISDYSKMQVGDLFIKGGFPGHAVTVMDMAENPETGKKVFLLSQSYMPAQEIHILRNPNNETLSPWYELDFEGDLSTPEWSFARGTLRRFE